MVSFNGLSWFLRKEQRYYFCYIRDPSMISRIIDECERQDFYLYIAVKRLWSFAVRFHYTIVVEFMVDRHFTRVFYSPYAASCGTDC